MAMIAVRGEFKQNFVKAAIRIHCSCYRVIHLRECLHTETKRGDRERKKQNKTKTEKKLGPLG